MIMADPADITIIAAINNHSVAESNLGRSSLLKANGVQFIPAEGFGNASYAYNYGLTRATGEIVIFAHQDVYIPERWPRLLFDAIAVLDRAAPPWAVLGVVGVDHQSVVKGRAWSTGLGREVGLYVIQPEPVVSLDELLLVVRKSSGLVFDEHLPGWHLYGTDIVQEALRRNLGAYVIPAPVIHNSLPVVRFDNGFAQCYHYLRRKWSLCLPLQTCCIKLTRSGWPFVKRQIRQALLRADRRTYARLPDPAAKARELGYE